MNPLRKGGVVTVTAAMLVLASCSSQRPSTTSSTGGSNDKTLTIAETNPPQTFDPSQSSQIATMYAWQNVYNGLARVDANGKPLPDLATKWTISEDGLTYDFTLREGVTFSDGTPLTSEDVVFSYKRLLSEGLPYSQSRFADLESVKAIDATHVQFKLKRPNAGFILNVGSPFFIGSAILSKKFAESHDPKTNVLGTGPFKVKSYTPNQELVLVRNDKYWNKDGLPKFGTLKIKYIPDQSAQVAALSSGQVDLMFPSAENSVQLKNIPKLKVASVEGTNTVRLNVNSGRKPFDNADVRRAIALSLNRDEIVQGAFLGMAKPSAQIPPSLPGALPLSDLANQTRDVAKAKELLAKAGFPNGLKITLDHLAGYATYLDRFSQLVKSQLAEAGIEVAIEANQNSVWLDHQNNAKYDIMDNVYSFNGDPMTLLSPRPGRQGPTPPEVTAAMEKATSGKPDDYMSNLQSLLKLENELVFPDIAVATPMSMIAYGEHVSGAKPEPTLARQFLAAVTVN